MRLIRFLIVMVTTGGCASSQKIEINTSEVAQEMNALKPKILECWRRLEPEDRFDSLQEVSLSGELRKNGTFETLDVISQPKASKASEACIERVSLDSQFKSQTKPLQVRFRLKF